MTGKRRRILAGNWKLHKTPEETRLFLQEWRDVQLGDLESIFFVPAFCIETAVEATKASQASTSHDPVSIGVQNIYFENSGAFTGENSPEVARQIGAKWALVGHSERRALFNETDEHIAKKIRAALTVGLSAMLCIGETLSERDQAATELVLKRQLQSGLKDLDPKWASMIAIAYEPVWAIGTGRTATTDQIQSAHQVIRETLVELSSVLQKIPIVYGGSVKPENASAIARVDEVDGFLVGGASLRVDSMKSLAQAL